MARRVLLVAVTSLALAALLTPLTLAQPAPAPLAPPPLATINGDAITRGQWESFLGDAYGAKALRELIEDRLVVQEAHRLKIVVVAAEVDQRITQMRADYPDDAAFEAMLRDRGISLQGLKHEVKQQLLLGKIVDTMARVTDEQIAAYYQVHLAEFSKPTRVHLYAISTDDPRAAYLAAERLAKNEEFAAVAKELSKDEFAEKGGDRGWVSAEEVQPEAVRVAAFALEPGARSEPIEAAGEVYVLWIKERQPGFVVALADARDQIRDRLRAEKGLSPQSVLNGLIARATIKVNDPPLASVAEALEKVKQVHVVVDDKPLELDRAPFRTKAGRLMVPAKPLLRAIGATMKWWPDTRTLQVTKGDQEVWLAPESQIAIVNKTQKATIDQPPIMKDGVLYVAPRWLVEQLGGSVAWSAEENTLKVKSVRPAPTEEPFPSPSAP